MQFFLRENIPFSFAVRVGLSVKIKSIFYTIVSGVWSMHVEVNAHSLIWTWRLGWGM
jgi:hypothetical protein